MKKLFNYQFSLVDCQEFCVWLVSFPNLKLNNCLISYSSPFKFGTDFLPKNMADKHLPSSPSLLYQEENSSTVFFCCLFLAQFPIILPFLPLDFTLNFVPLYYILDTIFFTTQEYILHAVRNTVSRVRKRDREGIVEDLKRVYRAEPIEKAKENMER